MTAVADSSVAPGHEIDRSGDPLIRAEGVWKIFGRHADKVIGTPDAERLHRALAGPGIGDPHVTCWE